MRWNNLKKEVPECPQCGEFLEFNERNNRYICSDLGCDFSIGIEKFDEITGDEPIFSGTCETCGKEINPHYRTCKNCM